MRRAVLEGADAAGGPFRADAARLARRLDAGQTVPEVIRWWAAARRSPELARLALVADAGTRVGGELARALDGVAAAMTDRRDVAAEARSLSSQARASAVLLVAAPLLFGVAMAGVQPEGIQFLVGTPGGWATLVTALLLDAVGGFWLYRLTERAR
jgi:tight adherence protein B